MPCLSVETLTEVIPVGRLRCRKLPEKQVSTNLGKCYLRDRREFEGKVLECPEIHGKSHRSELEGLARRISSHKDAGGN